MVKISVVDDEDNLIGSEERDFVDKKRLMYWVSALWITNSKGEILLARRAYTKSHSPGKWGPAVAGTVEEGESYDSNIIREAEEEIGLKNFVLAKSQKTKTRGNHNYFTQWFTTIVDSPLENFKIQESGVAEIKWFSIEELKQELKTNPDQFLLNMTRYSRLFAQ